MFRRPLTLEVIASEVIWPQEDWNFCRVRCREEGTLPLGAVVPRAAAKAATYREVCLRTRSIELVHNADTVDACTKSALLETPSLALIYSMVRAPTSLRRVRLELLDREEAPSLYGRLTLTTEMVTFIGDDGSASISHSMHLYGSAAAGKHLRSRARCAEAALSVAVDKNAVTIMHQ
jgi:hypothetical protein